MATLYARRPQDPITHTIAVGEHAQADITGFGTIGPDQRVVITGIFIHSTAGAAEVLTIRAGTDLVGIPIPLVITLDSKQITGLDFRCAVGDLPTRTASAALVSGSIVITFTWELESA